MGGREEWGGERGEREKKRGEWKSGGREREGEGASEGRHTVSVPYFSASTSHCSRQMREDTGLDCEDVQLLQHLQTNQQHLFPFFLRQGLMEPR